MSTSTLRRNQDHELALPQGPITRSRSKQLKQALQGFLKPYIEALQVHCDEETHGEQSALPWPNVTNGFQECLFAFFSICNE